MSATRLLILGLLRWAQPAHGYEVRRELMSWGAAEWSSLRPGSIYHALKQMTAEGLLSPVGTEQVGNRPARTRYRLTDRGELEFRRLLGEYWWQYKRAVDPFQVALPFLSELSPREAAAALRNRAKLLETEVHQLTSLLDSDWITDKPPQVAEMFRLWIAHGEAERAWCERVADRVDRGEMHQPVERTPKSSGN